MSTFSVNDYINKLKNKGSNQYNKKEVEQNRIINVEQNVKQNIEQNTEQNTEQTQNTKESFVLRKYLNERRDLWHSAYPEFNIWEKEKSKLYAGKNDINNQKNKKLHLLLFTEQVIGKSTILLEKLPINSFRLEFLINSFPDAKFIYIHRNGLEVSSSISKKITKLNWFGKKSRKWDMLLDLAKRKNERITNNISSNLQKGMLEWRMSMEESHKFFKSLEKNKFIHISYEDLVSQPQKSIKKMFEFLKIPYSTNLIEKCAGNIKRQSSCINKTKDKSLLTIGGEFLTNTINNTYSPD